MLNYFAWLVVGLIIGGLFGIMRQRRDQNHDMTLDVFFGILAAGIGGMLLAPMLGMGTQTGTGFGIGASIVAIVSSLLMLLGVTFARYRASR